MTTLDLSSSTLHRRDGADEDRGVSIDLRLGRRIQRRDVPVALRLEAVVADSRAAADPPGGTCTVRLSLLPEGGEVSTFYLSLDPGAPELAAVSAFGYRISLRDVTPRPADDDACARDDVRATVVLERVK